MKIACFVCEFPPRIVGGLGTYAAEITREFIKKGHDVSVFTVNDGTLKTREIIGGIEVHRPLLVNMSKVLPDLIVDDVRRWGTVGMQFFSEIFVCNILSASKFVNQLVLHDKEAFKIIAIHDWLSSIAGILSKEMLRLPLVFHVHSTEEGRSLGDGSKTIIELERKAAAHANAIITVSYAMRDELISLGYPAEKIHVVWNGVDPAKYNPSNVSPETVQALRRQYGVDDKEKLILCLARLTRVKGVDKMVLAMPHILQKHPEAKLVLVGKGDMENYLVDLIGSLKLRDKVQFNRSFLPEHERIAHYAAADVVVFPSLYEPFGIVALEAMSMEKPVVVGARGICGFREIVVPHGPEQNGFHVNAYDPADIAWGVNSILDDPGRSKILGVNGRQRVLKEFTWERAADRTLKIYEQIISEAKS
ncbi:MAG: glycosyltransferase family 4 protein [Candidatus Bathyarchaeia archaeon]